MPNDKSQLMNPTNAAPRGRRPAFTLIELLVVIGIMVLLIALAVPAFNFLTGSRSVESASNQVAAVLGIARAEAVGLQETRGVAIFYDPSVDREVAALVELRTGPFAAWDTGATALNPVPYTLGEYRSYNGQNYVCVESYVDKTGTTKPDTAGNGYWRALASCNPSFSSTGGDPTPIVEFRPNTDYLTLTKGISVWAVANPFLLIDTKTSAKTYFRYTSPAVFMFDGNGQLKSLDNFRVLNEGLLGVRAGLDPTNTSLSVSPPYVASGTYRPYHSNSGLGLVLAGKDEFKAATSGFDAGRWQDWLDQNASPELINRYNGTLVKGE